ncbi:DnaA regulatory inactivator Hda [Burkholderia glumae BGR1]|nr:DnaA regulatory inactivator Hda [Burkholderia glumae BGR1]
MGECEKVGKMRFYPKPDARPNSPRRSLQVTHRVRIVPVFVAGPPVGRRARRAAAQVARGRRGCDAGAPRLRATRRRLAPGRRTARARPHPIRTVTATRQLTLDLGTPPPATFENFTIGPNDELVSRLRRLDLALAAGPVADRSFYVWGEAGSGRSHLLQALVHDTSYGSARYLTPQSPLGAIAFDPRVSLYAVDDIDAMSDTQQIALFNLFNEVRAHPSSAFVGAGPAAPLALDVREDLRTRLGWGLVFHLAPLSDADKAVVFKQAAKARGIAIADDVPAYLLTHYRRDMPSLMALLDALDRFSLEQKRAVTLPLLRALLTALEREADASGRIK